MEDLPTPGTHSFMTVDAFDVELGAGPDCAIVTKDHSGPMGSHGRTSAEHDQAIARENAWLRSASDVPGVARLAPDSPSEQAPAVRTVFAGGRTLRSDCPGEHDTALALSSVCRTLAELQKKQMVHGSVAPEHIIIAADLSTTLCSPNTSGDPIDDLIALGQCIEFATEQWATHSDRIEDWLVLAKRLRDGDPSLSPERVASSLQTIISPPPRSTRPRLGWLAAFVAISCGAALGWLMIRQAPSTAPGGPEVEVAGMIVRVGDQGQVALTRPADACGSAQVFLLDPTTYRVWKFDNFTSGMTGTAIAMVPGATELVLTTDGRCATMTAKGPAGSVVLES